MRSHNSTQAQSHPLPGSKWFGFLDGTTKQVPSFLVHILASISLHLWVICYRGANPAPALLGTTAWEDAAPPPPPQSPKQICAVLHQQHNCHLLAGVKHNFCYLLLYKLPLPTSQKALYTLFSCQRLFTNVRGWQPESQLSHIARLHKISPEPSSTVNAV